MTRTPLFSEPPPVPLAPWMETLVGLCRGWPVPGAVRGTSDDELRASFELLALRGAQPSAFWPSCSWNVRTSRGEVHFRLALAADDVSLHWSVNGAALDDVQTFRAALDGLAALATACRVVLRDRTRVARA